MIIAETYHERDRAISFPIQLRCAISRIIRINIKEKTKATGRCFLSVLLRYLERSRMLARVLYFLTALNFPDLTVLHTRYSTLDTLRETLGLLFSRFHSRIPYSISVSTWDVHATDHQRGEQWSNTHLKCPSAENYSRCLNQTDWYCLLARVITWNEVNCSFRRNERSRVLVAIAMTQEFPIWESYRQSEEN